MPRRALRVCTTPGCPNLTPTGRCDTCKGKAETRRGTAAQRGYGHMHRTRFRHHVLLTNPLCVCVDTTHPHTTPCHAISTVADHWPLDRAELVRQGHNPNDPTHGRGLCKPCHDRHTAHTHPGWNTH